MSIFKKILILNNIGLLIIIFLAVYFFWSQSKRVTPIVIPSSFSSEVSLESLSSYLTPKGIPSEKAVLSDPPSGNSGEVEISLKRIRNSIEISWPKEYQIYSLVFKNLGETEKIDDNKVIFGFTTDKPRSRPFLKAGPITIERTKMEPPIIIDPPLTQIIKFLPEITLIALEPSEEMILEFKKGQGYSIEALFEKEGEDKVYVGLYGFVY